MTQKEDDLSKKNVPNSHDDSQQSCGCGSCDCNDKDIDELIKASGTTVEEEEVTQIQKLQKDLVDLTDLVKRKQADFENYQKRMETQSNQMVGFATQRVLTKLIPIIDMFEIAMKHKENVSEFMSGVEMIHTSFAQFLTDEHVVSPSLVGQKFDPKIARAVGTKVVNGTEAGIVLEQTTNCYILNDRTIKYANVIVSATAQSSDVASKK